MNKEIIVESINVLTKDITTTIVYSLNNQGSNFDLWYEFDSKFFKYLSINVCDAVIVCLLPYAMHYGLNIRTKISISEKLLYNLKNYLIPVLSKNLPDYFPKPIDVFANATICVDNKGNHVGTGVSGGVDSFYTIIKNIKSHSKESCNNIDTLCIFNVGACGQGKEGSTIYKQRVERAKEINSYFKCELMCVDSNVPDFYLSLDFESTHIFRTLSVPLLFQKYFSLYYFSSTFPVELFKFSSFDPGYYEIFLLPIISTESLSFIEVGGEVSRLEKVEYIAKHEVVKKHLNVCVGNQDNNCNQCFKCKRTLLNLYLTNNLDNFFNVFDINFFKNNINQYLQYAYNCRNDVDMMEIYLELKRRKEFKFRHFFVHKFINLKKFFLQMFKFGVRVLKDIKHKLVNVLKH